MSRIQQQTEQAETVDVADVDRLVQKLGRGPESTIPLLQAIQDHYQYLPTPALERLCEITDITPAQVAGVSTFYTQFRHRPAGKHRIKVCIGTACHVKGAGAIYDAFRDYLNIEGDEDTDADGLFTVEKVACLGCCMLAVAVQMDETIYGHVKTSTVGQVIHDYLASLDEEDTTAPPATFEGEKVGMIRISMDTCCIASGAEKVARAMNEAVRKTGARAMLKTVGCWGKSYLEPLVEVVPVDGERVLYQGVSPEDAEAIVRRHFKPRGVIQRAKIFAESAIENLLTDQSWGICDCHAMMHYDPAVREFDDQQKRVATEYCGQAKPTDLDEYLQHDGFVAMKKVLHELSPEEVIGLVSNAEVRGRGGGGYPTGLKWRQVRQQPGDEKYVVCNGDEGDPGAFMDRMLLESQPFRIIEGIVIGSYAVGASKAYLYVRAEYPLAVSRMREAIDKATRAGLLGDRIAGSDFSLHLDIMQGAGAFVCGEETALLASMEGKRGMPRLRPPYPAEAGLWDKPTLVNNTETFSLIPWVIRNGPERFAAMGTEKSKGTKVFALAGKVARGGLVEVPMGMTIREIVEDIGGGIPEGREFKAVQIGGPSGGCIPASLADTPIDYEELVSLGAMMGSGGLVVLDDTDCMVDIARYFLEFTQGESCGKCTFCRVGTRHMLEILTRLCEGEGTARDIERLEELCLMIPRGSLCGLGKTAPNPVTSTLEYFRQEYEAHVEGKCPAGKCPELIRYWITEDCIGCTRCAQICPADAIEMRPYEQHEIDPELCVRCGACKVACPVDAIRVE